MCVGFVCSTHVLAFVHDLNGRLRDAKCSALVRAGGEGEVRAS